MRGGTSRALFLMDNHLPEEPTVRDAVILALFGSPDPNKRQIDGLGGAVSSTSKVAIISPSNDPKYDINYNFGQVSIDRPMVDYRGNCGNILSAVGPFAVDQGLVPAEAPITKVRIHQINTNKLIVAHVPVKDGHFDYEGEYAINGVPGTGNRIDLHFHNPGGSVTGDLLPTGNPIDRINISGIENIDFSLVDAANPYVFIRAADVGLKGTEIATIDQNKEIKEKLELIRCYAAVMCGLADTPEEASATSQAIPKVALIAPPQSYTTVGGETIKESEVDIVIRLISMGTLHKAIAVTGAICSAGAAMIPGTIVNKTITTPQNNPLFIGHPSGIIDVTANVVANDENPDYQKAVIGRTARRLMEGYALVQKKHFRK